MHGHRFPMVMTLALALSIPAPFAVAAGDWMVSLHAGQTEVDTVIREDGPWWTRVDDDRKSLGLSVGYDWIPELGMRLLYERATGVAAVNQCPPGRICPAVAIPDEVDADLWSLAALPRWYVTDNWSMFATVGLVHSRLRTKGPLPGGSDTDLTYGLGTSWLLTPALELGMEYQRSELDHQTLRMNLGWRFGAW